LQNRPAGRAFIEKNELGLAAVFPLAEPALRSEGSRSQNKSHKFKEKAANSGRILLL
jgi:hypothetical protein